MIQAVLNKLLAGDLSGLEGSHFQIDLPLKQRFVNQLLQQRPPSPLETLEIQALDGNQCWLYLAARLPAVGRQERKLRLALQAHYQAGQQEWLHFDILEGLKLLDKPLLSVANRLLNEKIPQGVALSSQRLSLHLPSLTKLAKKENLLPHLQSMRIQSQAGILQITLQIHVLA